MTSGSDERPALEDQRLATVVALRQLMLAVERYRLEVAVHIGVTVNESQVFSHLFVNGPMGQTDLARAMSLTTSTLTAMIDRLEARGLIERRHDPCDRRRSIVALSALGERELAGVRHWMTHALEGVPADQLVGAGELFETVASSMRDFTTTVSDMESKFEKPRRRI